MDDVRDKVDVSGRLAGLKVEESLRDFEPRNAGQDKAPDDGYWYQNTTLEHCQLHIQAYPWSLSHSDRCRTASPRDRKTAE